MKPSTILAVVLPVLALASPATKPRAARPERARLHVSTHGKRAGPEEDFEALQQCLYAHNTFTVDWTKESEGEFTVDNLNPTCCEKAKALAKYMDMFGKGKLGELVFGEDCTELTVTGASSEMIRIYREFAESFHDDE